ncbi:MAG: phosphatidylserine decarboxylase [Limisphaerales bacterium]
MKHAGKSSRAALRLIYWTLLALLTLMFAGALAQLMGALIVTVAGGLVGLWLVFCVFCLWFFRDPEPSVPRQAEAIVAPAHGRVDVIDELEEPDFMGGPCRRVSIFMSVFDVHVQRSPVAGRIAWLKHTPGQFLNAMRSDSAQHNENVLMGFESNERPGERIGVRLIAGLIARRIVSWVKPGDPVERGERVSLIQFGSRCDVYLPLSSEVKVKLGDRVRGGVTVLASRP